MYGKIKRIVGGKSRGKKKGSKPLRHQDDNKVEPRYYQLSGETKNKIICELSGHRIEIRKLTFRAFTPVFAGENPKG